MFFSLSEAEGRNEDDNKSSKSGIIKLDAIREIIDKVSGRGLSGRGLSGRGSSGRGSSGRAVSRRGCDWAGL